MSAYKKWTDEYLMRNYGNEIIDVEVGKKEDRKFGHKESLSLSEFLTRYKTTDIYLIQDIPENMKVDVGIPSSLLCGGFQNMIDVVLMWFSSGDTKSALHKDHMDNINCLLDGKKDIVLFDRKYKDLVESDGFNVIGGFSDVDVDSVDMYQFPNLQHVPWYKANLTKGDCLYIPFGWYHYVYSQPGRNLALNLWFQNLYLFNKTDCDNIAHNFYAFIPINELPKPEKIEQYKQELVRLFDGKYDIERKEFIYELGGLDIDIDETFNIIDKDGSGFISVDELYSYDDVNFYKRLEEYITRLTGEEDGSEISSFDDTFREESKVDQDEDEENKNDNDSSKENVAFVIGGDALKNSSEDNHDEL